LKLTLAQLKSPKGLLIGFLVLSTITISTIIFFLARNITSGPTNLDSQLLMQILKECLKTGDDDKKTSHLFKAEREYFLAKAAASRGDYKSGHESWQETIYELGLACGDKSVIVGIFLKSQGDFETEFGRWKVVEAIDRRALACFDASLSNPLIAFRCRQQLAVALQKQNKFAEAIKLFQENISTAEGFDKANNTPDGEEVSYAMRCLAWTYALAGQTETAAETYERLIKKLEKFPQKNEGIAAVLVAEAELFKNRDPNRAVALLSRATQAHPQSAEAHSTLGQILDEQKKYSTAVEEFTKAIAIDPKDSNFYNWRSHAYSYAGPPEKGLADANKAVELSPDDFSPREQRAIAYDQLKQYDNALENWNQAISLSHGRFSYHFERRAQVYEEMGKKDLAAADRLKAAQMKDRQHAPVAPS